MVFQVLLNNFWIGFVPNVYLEVCLEFRLCFPVDTVFLGFRFLEHWAKVHVIWIGSTVFQHLTVIPKCFFGKKHQRFTPVILGIHPGFTLWAESQGCIVGGNNPDSSFTRLPRPCTISFCSPLQHHFLPCFFWLSIIIQAKRAALGSQNVFL